VKLKRFDSSSDVRTLRFARSWNQWAMTPIAVL